MKKIHYFLLIAVVGAFSIFATYLVNNVGDYSPREAKQIGEFTVKGQASIIGPAMEEIYSLKNNQITGTYSADDVEQALAEANALSNNTRRIASPFNWISEGPDNIGGRTRAFIIDKDDPNLMFAAGVSGGLFRSTTGGASWDPVNDFEDELFIVSMVQDKDGNIYYGVGESIFAGGTTFAAKGIYKSDTRDGTSFTELPGNSRNFDNVGALATNKSTGRIFAGSGDGFYYSDDQGATWTKPSGLAGNCRDIAVASDGTVFAFMASNKVRRSADGSGGFEDLTVPFSDGYQGSVGRVELAVSPQDPNYVYAVAAGNDGSLNGIYGSTDKGTTWDLLASGGSPFNDALSQVNTLQGQGIYDLTISVDPDDKEHIYYGGVQMGEYHPDYGMRVIASLTDNATNTRYVHADKHLIEWDVSKTPATLIVCTDGGIFFSYDKGATFARKNFGYTTTQFYGVAANYLGSIFGGTQDNSCIQITHDGNSTNANGVSRNGERLLSGDGFQTEYSANNHLAMVGESQYGNVRRSDDGGKTFECFWDDRIGSTADEVCDKVSTSRTWAPFNTELALFEWDSMVRLIDTFMVKKDSVINGVDSFVFVEEISDRDSNLTISQLFYSKNNEVWVCNNVFNFDDKPTWFKLASGFSGAPRDLEISPDGSELLLVTSGNAIYRINGLRNANYDPDINVNPKNSIPAGITITKINNLGNGLPGGSRTVTSVSFNPSNKNHVLVTYANYGNSGSYVYETMNAMDAVPTYTNITNNFPTMPVYDGCLVTIDNKLHYILGSEFGIWASDNSGASWTEENVGLARIPVYHVKAYHWQDWKKPSIFVASHGRGVYSHNSPFHVDYTGIKDVVTKDDSKGKKEALKMYPNPALNFTTIDFDAEGRDEVDIKVYDINGQVVLTQKVMSTREGLNKVKLHINMLKAGNYFVKLVGGSTDGFAKLVVVK